MDQQTSPFPPVFLQRMEARLKDQFEAFTMALQAPAPSSVRLNPEKPSDRFTNDPQLPWCPLGRSLPVRPSFTGDPLFHAGAYYVQEASSMFLWHVLEELIDPNRTLRALDLSAAPGGKTTLLQSYLSKDSLIVANEVIGSRNKILRQNLARWGCDNVIISQNDPLAFETLPDFFDILLIDAPCSGEGLFRKDAAAIGEWSEQHLNHCAKRQKRILNDTIASLRPGGLLIYSTCTFNEAENEAQIRDLIQTHGFEAQALNIPSHFGIVASPLLAETYYSYPHLTNGEGFFIAALRKPGQDAARYETRHSKRRPKIFGKATDEDQKWIKEIERYAFMDRGEHRIALPSLFVNDYLRLSKALYLTGSGLNMGRLYHGQLRPSPELALFTGLADQIPRVELDRSEALKYLSHQTLAPLDLSGTGWHLASHQGLALGWFNQLKTGQLKNNYPSAWRILKPELFQS